MTTLTSAYLIQIGWRELLLLAGAFLVLAAVVAVIVFVVAKLTQPPK